MSFTVDEEYVEVAANHLHQVNCTYTCEAIVKITQDGQIWGAVIEAKAPKIEANKGDKFVKVEPNTFAGALIRTRKEVNKLGVDAWVLLDEVKPSVNIKLPKTKTNDREELNFDWLFTYE